MIMHFTRLDNFTLKPGNKTAGFTLAVSRDALAYLIRQKNKEQTQEWIIQEAQKRLIQSGLVDENFAQRANIEFYKDTLCPRVFLMHDMFGGSIGAEPNMFDKLLQENYYETLYIEEYYTPHNVDDPRTAMALMMLTQTWTEEAFGLLLSMDRVQTANPPVSSTVTLDPTP